MSGTELDGGFLQATADGTDSAAHVIRDTTLAATEPTVFDGDHGPLASFIVPAGAKLHLVDVAERIEKWQENPSRKTGTFKVHDGDSFVAYMAKHSLIESEVWADAQGQRIVGVINAHSDDAGWGDHRVVYEVAHTESWKAWKALDGKLGSQAAFAQLIEDRLIDILKPDAADLLEIVQTIEAAIGTKVQSSRLLSNGERQFTYKETIEGAAGRSGQFEIPKEFELVLQPFEGAEPQTILARLRYRIDNGDLLIGFKLVRPEDMLREAFNSVVEVVQTGVDAPVFNGVTG
jgi:uncharacterized protein YfdQ (DUF2303 family)